MQGLNSGAEVLTSGTDPVTSDEPEIALIDKVNLRRDRESLGIWIDLKYKWGDQEFLDVPRSSETELCVSFSAEVSQRHNATLVTNYSCDEFSLSNTPTSHNLLGDRADWRPVQSNRLQSVRFSRSKLFSSHGYLATLKHGHLNFDGLTNKF